MKRANTDYAYNTTITAIIADAVNRANQIYTANRANTVNATNTASTAGTANTAITVNTANRANTAKTANKVNIGPKKPTQSIYIILLD